MIHPRPLKRFGQHFLTDGGAITRIVKTLAAEAGESVLEIGPGRGALTRVLHAALTDVGGNARLAVVEIDRELAANLTEKFPDVRCYQMDVLDVDLASVRSDLDPAGARRLKIAGNLPYNISKPIAMKLIRDRAHVDHAVLMFQKEVANRLVAEVGCKEYGPLTVLAGLAFDIRRVFDLGPRAFRPRPAVDSSVTEWRRRSSSPLTSENESALKQTLTACFARRRQTLRNNLRAALRDADVADQVMKSVGLDPSLRAERVSPTEFIKLAAAWPATTTESARAPHAKRERRPD